MSYYIYHIIGEKVGMSCESRGLDRLIEDQKVREGEYEILQEGIDDLEEALDIEQYENDKRGYRKTRRWHPHLNRNKMRDEFKDNQCKTITVISDYANQIDDFCHQDKVSFSWKGNDYVFEGSQVKLLHEIVKPSTFPGNTSGYIEWRDVRELFEKLQDVNVLRIYDAEVTVSKKQFNKCSDLEINTTNKTIDDVFELQKSLQQKFPETSNIGNDNIADTAVAAQRNLHAFMDEVMEFMDALGGVHDGFGNGAWKYWKKDYQKAKRMGVTDLSDRDLLELKFEYVDMFHFFINWGLMIGMTGQELIDMYVTKNKENFDRQKRGY